MARGNRRCLSGIIQCIVSTAFTLTWLATSVSAVQLSQSYTQQSVNSTVPWTACGFYGLSYTAVCTGPVYARVSAYNTQGCGSNSSFTITDCPPLQQGSLCNSYLSCQGSWFIANSQTLCLVISPSSSLNYVCDIAIIGEYAPIADPGGGLAWPVWQIVAVSVGGGLGFLIMCGCCILLFFMTMKWSSKVAPESADATFIIGSTGMAQFNSHKESLPYAQEMAPPLVPTPYMSVRPPPPLALPIIPELPPRVRLPTAPQQAGTPSWFQQQAAYPNLSPGTDPNPFTMAREVEAKKHPDWSRPPTAQDCTPAMVPWPAPPNSNMYTAVPNAAPVSHKLQYPPHFFLNQKPAPR